MKYDFLSIGNICIDLYFKGKSLTHSKDRFNLAIGGKYYTDSFYESIGGGGCNVAIGVASYGISTAVFSRLGENHFKEVILKKLKEKNVSAEFCQHEKNYLIMSTILLTDEGERTIISYDTPGHMTHDFFLHEELKKTKNIYISSLSNVALEDKIKIITYLKGDQTMTYVNLSITDCRREVEALEKIFDALDVLIINTHEYSEMVKKPYESIDFKNPVIDLPFLKERVVIITDAEKGSYGYFQGKIFYQEAIKPAKIVDTTGCGDAYTAGFIASYIKTKDIQKSMLQGAKHASEKMTRLGAS